MPVKAIGKYDFAPRDRIEDFHGSQLVFLLWERHLMFASPIAVPLPPTMPWAAVTGRLLPQLYGQHPDFAAVRWSAVTWNLDDAPFSPDPAKSIGELGIGHKSMIRFSTPGLEGLSGAAF